MPGTTYSLLNHYEILGLNSSAGTLEIKSAFRRLAKLYHPDKNPEGKEHFNKILRAYEILSDPIQKSNYDYRLKYQLSSSSTYETKTTGTKTWRFDEKELKRRQYYNDYIKKQTQASSVEPNPVQKKVYNEYKYIFFATPLAVALFLLIMNLATPHQSPPSQHTVQPPVATTALTAEVKTGTPFYENVFGMQQFDSLGGKPLTVKNNSGSDVLVCLFSRDTFVRSFFINAGDRFLAEYLPADFMELQYFSGDHFQPEARVNDHFNFKGNFADDRHFFKNHQSIALKKIHEITLYRQPSNFDSISAAEFFKTE